ncbi:hypothetical protein V1478_003665 [Vespula squamosa]|uniref:Uncharacterized protein n=1 Tax=Vespula squamosa TaxID=30214 RepID=A0ABD2BMG4_VESSQ
MYEFACKTKDVLTSPLRKHQMMMIMTTIRFWFYQGKKKRLVAWLDILPESERSIYDDYARSTFLSNFYNFIAALCIIT